MTRAAVALAGALCLAPIGCDKSDTGTQDESEAAQKDPKTEPKAATPEASLRELNLSITGMT